MTAPCGPAETPIEMPAAPPITGATTVLAILGRPIAHALTPLIQNTALAAAGVDGVFVAFSPTEDDLDLTLRGLVAGGCAGLCITIPYKTGIVPLLDELGPSAADTGAVNTVVVGEGGRLVGHNTDVDGVLLCYRALPDRSRDHALVLGAGGAARAAVAAVARTDIKRLTIINRTRAKAEAVKRDFAGSGLDIATAAFAEDRLAELCREAQLLINTTSIGMYPNGADSPVPATALHGGLDVIDAVYRPQPTRLCREAMAAGAHALAGLDWIIGQAVVAMKYWMGFDADEKAMRRVLDAYLSHQP